MALEYGQTCRPTIDLRSMRIVSNRTNALGVYLLSYSARVMQCDYTCELFGPGRLCT